MNVCGIDVSTYHLDFAFLDDDAVPEWKRISLQGDDAWERTRTVRVPSDWFADTYAAGMEVAHGPSSGAINRVVGAVLARLPNNTLVQPWTASEWKKAVELPGNASKGHVRIHVIGQELNRVKYQGDRGYLYPAWFDEWAEELTFDQADAYCIALATQKALERQAA